MIFFNTKASRYFVLGQEFLKYSHIWGLKTCGVNVLEAVYIDDFSSQNGIRVTSS